MTWSRPHGEVRAPVRWGATLGALAIAVIVASFAFGYLYLWSDAEAWPPVGESPPAVGWPAVAGVLVVVATVGAFVAATADGGRLHGGLAVGWSTGLGSTVVLWLAIADSGWRPTDHAYGSISMLLLGALVVVAGVATAGSALIHLRVLLGAPPAWLDSARWVNQVMWTLVLVVAIIVAVTVVAIPHAVPR